MKERRDAFRVSYSELREYIMSNAENGFFHHSFGMEESFQDAMTNTNLHGNMKMPESMQDAPIGVMALNPVKQAEYSAVAAAILLTRFAITAGADSTEAYCLGDMYLQRISELKSAEDCWNGVPVIVRSFQELVRMNKARREQDYHIQKVKNYIAQHLSTPFTLSDLAEYAELSPNYLCALFRKTEGTAVMDYVRHSRIEAARSMLKFSNRSVREIGNYLCFSSQSHFGSVFKKETGMTPGEFRSVYHSW